MIKFLSLVFLAFLGISASASAPISVTESWGGQGISVRVFSDESAAVQFDCAASPSSLYVKGRFWKQSFVML